MFPNNLGNGGFNWFVCKVEDLNDPLQVGRVKIRIMNLHPDDQTLSTDELPWATVAVSATSASLNGVGLSPTGIQKGTIAIGYFADARAKQIPILIFTLYTIPENDQKKNNVNALARGKNNIKKEQLGPEPKSAYGTKYPANKVYSTPSGHVIEIDDTEGAERIHIFHKSGTYLEINNEGRVVFKSIGEAYSIHANNTISYTKGNANVHITGNVVIQCDGNIAANVGGDANLTVKGSITANAASWSLSGDATWDGKLTVSDDVIGGGISLKNHTHGGVDTGSGKTQSPN